MNRAQGEGTSNQPNPALFYNNVILDPNVLAEMVTPENAVARAGELDIARQALLQQKREVEAERQRMVAQQAQLDEQENRLRQNMSTQQT